MNEGPEPRPRISWRAPTGPPRAPAIGPPPESQPPTAAAGWYPDPLGIFQQRWWDGTHWTEHGQGGTRRHDAMPGWVLIGGAGAMVLGSFLPWAKLTAPFVGTINVTGTTGDGTLTLIAGIVVALLGFPLAQGPTNRTRVIGALVVAAAAGIVCLVDIVNVERVAREAEESNDLVEASVGYGLWLTSIGALNAGAGALAGLMGRRGRGQR